MLSTQHAAAPPQGAPDAAVECGMHARGAVARVSGGEHAEATGVIRFRCHECAGVPLEASGRFHTTWQPIKARQYQWLWGRQAGAHTSE